MYFNAPPIFATFLILPGSIKETLFFLAVIAVITKTKPMPEQATMNNAMLENTITTNTGTKQVKLTEQINNI